MKFKVADTVKVVLGKDRGKTGKIIKVLPKKNAVVVKGINLYKKHLKAQGQDRPGGIIDITRPLNVAKVALVCPKCKKQTRVAYDGQGRQKVRICCKCRQPIDIGGDK